MKYENIENIDYFESCGCIVVCLKYNSVEMNY